MSPFDVRTYFAGWTPDYFLYSGNDELYGYITGQLKAKETVQKKAASNGHLGGKENEKKTVPTRHAILMAGIQEEKRQAQLKEAYGITEEVTVGEKSRTAQLLRVLVNAIFVMMRCVALVVLIVLAIIGVATLIYPNMRAAGLETWLEIETQLAEYLCK